MPQAPRPRAPLKTEELFEALRARIVSDDWRAGALLPSERELAQRYNTNRNTLREAIRRLEQAGLVTVRQGRGVTVSDFRKTGTLELLAPFLMHGSDMAEKARMILDLLEPRMRMIEYGVERMVARHRERDLPALEGAVALARSAELRRDPGAVVQAESVWYEALVAAAHDQVVAWLARPVLQINTDVVRHWPMLVFLEPSLARYLGDVLSAAVARDGVRACALTRSHYEAVDATVRAVLEPFVAANRAQEEKQR